MFENVLIEDTRKMFLRPLILSLGFSVIGEFLLLIIYGILLFSIGGMLGSIIAGAGIGGLLFSKTGQSLMVKTGI